MIVKQKRNIKLFVIQFGAALAISFAGFFFSRIKNKRIKPSPPSAPSDHGSDSKIESRKTEEAVRQEHLNICVSGDLRMPKGTINSSRDSSNRKDQLIIVKEFPEINEFETPLSVSCDQLEFPSRTIFEYDEEITQLRNTIEMLQEKEKNLEGKLLHYHGLKEQEKVAMELHNRLKLNQMESKLLNLRIQSLQAENKSLNAQLADHAKVVDELELAKSQIKLLKKKLRVEALQNKERIVWLKERVVKLQEQEVEACAAGSDPDAETMEQSLRDLEAEIDELRKCNTRLLSENTDLAERLESAQILANSKLNDSEIEVINEECGRLRYENENMKTEIEQLQADRCTDVEELVYLRWINACLRYELRNYQPPRGKSMARDLSRTLSPNSEEKAKKLILEYANSEGCDIKAMDMLDLDYDQWSSSQDSLITDSADLDDSSIDASSASKTNKSGRKNLLDKLRKLIHGKKIQYHESHDNLESLSCSSTMGVVQNMPGSQSSRFVNPRAKLRHSMDFQMLMRNKRTELRGIGSESDRKSNVGSSIYKSMGLHGKSYSDIGNDCSIDAITKASERIELLKYAEALKNGCPANKLHRKSAS